jgi:hypothetical protein
VILNAVLLVVCEILGSFIAVLLQQVNLLTTPATFNFSNGSLNRVPGIAIVDQMEGTQTVSLIVSQEDSRAVSSQQR